MYPFNSLSTCLRKTAKAVVVAAVLAASGAATASPVFAADSGAAQTVASAPSVPVNLRVTAVSDTAISFDWDRSSHATADATQLQYLVFVNGVFREYASIPYGFGQTGWTIRNLSPGTTYAISVASQFGLTSAPSEPLSVTTTGTFTPPVATAPSVPSSLRLLSQTTTSLRVAWNPSTHPVAVTYQITYRVFVNGSLRQIVPGPLYGAPNVTLTGLTKNTTYRITVTAEFNGLTSAQSAALTATTTRR